MPSPSATSCAKVVSCPCPWLCDPVSTVTLPVGWTRTAAHSKSPARAPNEPTTAEAAQFAAARRLAPPSLEALNIGRLQREIQGRKIVAAVILQCDGRLIRVR